MDAPTTQSCTLLDLMAHIPMNSGKKYTHATSNLNIYPILLFILQTEEKATPPMKNAPSPVLSCASLVLWSTGQKYSARLFSIPNWIRVAHILPCTKIVKLIIPILHNIGFIVSNTTTPVYKDIQPTIDITNANHIKIWVNHIAVSIKYAHEKYSLIANDPMKPKTTTQPDDTGIKSYTKPLLKLHYSYVRST